MSEHYSLAESNPTKKLNLNEVNTHNGKRGWGALLF